MRSSLFLAWVVNDRGAFASLRSGVPNDDDAFGLLTVNGWESHAWVECDGHIVDITADQFGHAPIVVTAADDPTYRQAKAAEHRLVPTRAAIEAVTDIWPSWCRYAGR